MGKQRKITAVLPVDLLEQAMRESGEGLSETLRQGLALIAAQRAYRGLRALRGKVRVSIDLDSLRNET